MPSLYQSDPSSIISPQSDLMDELLWDRLSKFWAESYRPEDRQALNALYEASAKIADFEQVRLSEVNYGASISTCPLLSQRRWVRFDLNRYNDIQGFFRFLMAGGASSGDGSVGSGGGSDCDSGGSGGDGSTDPVMGCRRPSNNHSAHWHMSFSWVLPEGTPSERRTLDLGYPIDSTLTEIYRMEIDSKGRRSGIRLLPDRDFDINGTQIVLANGETGDEYDFIVGFDVSDRETYKDLIPRTAIARSPFPTNRQVTIPPSMSNGLPVHAMVVRNPAVSGSNSFLHTNNDSFSSVYEFIPFTGDSTTGAAHGPSGILTLPADTFLTTDDVVFVFGMDTQGGQVFNTIHAHERDTFYVTTQAGATTGAYPSVTAESPLAMVIPPTGAIPRGLQGSVDYLGQTVEVYVDGAKLSSSEYRYEAVTNELHFKEPLEFETGDPRVVDIRYTREYLGDPSQSTDLHIHTECWQEFAAPILEYADFDDLGDFDCDSSESEGTACAEPGAGASGTFDDTTGFSTIYLTEADLDEATLNVYVDGVLATPIDNYTISLDPGGAGDIARTRITFSIPITGKSVHVTYRRQGNVVIYGTDDLLQGSGNCQLNYGDIESLVGDPAASAATYAQTSGYSGDLAPLVEAAEILVGGGNPLFALFYDERPEYAQFPIDNKNLGIEGNLARRLESANTLLKSIPFMVDHVHRPTTRLEEGVHYAVVNGQLQTAQDLTLPRNSQDAAPGVWWIPQLILDESFLAKNFGVLLGDVRAESTDDYRDAIESNLHMRYNGPVAESISWAAAVMLGSPMFRMDGTVTSITRTPVAYDITMVNDQQDQTIRLDPSSDRPAVGEPVFAGQSVRSPAVFAGELANLVDWLGDAIIIQGHMSNIQQGDECFVELVIPGEDELVWTAFDIIAVQHSSIDENPVTTIRFRQPSIYEPSRVSRMRILRNVGAPFINLTGKVQSVNARHEWTLQTSTGEVFSFESAPEYAEGDVISRGQPLFPSLAFIYDERTRPDWYLDKPEHERPNWEYLTQGKTVRSGGTKEDTRQVIASPGAGGYTQLRFEPFNPAPLRGAKIDVAFDDGTRESFTITGTDKYVAYALPAVATERRGEGTFETLYSDNQRVRNNYYFESAIQDPKPLTYLLYPQLAGTTSLRVQATGDFPEAGRASVVVLNGDHEVGAFAFEYDGKTTDTLLNVAWEDDEFPGLSGPGEPATRLIPTTVRIRGVAKYESSRINSAFKALVTSRLQNVVGSQGNSVDLSDLAVAEEYYNLLKSSAAVLETSSVRRPQGLATALTDVVPPGMTLVNLYKHVIVETFDGEFTDA